MSPIQENKGQADRKTGLDCIGLVLGLVLGARD